MRRSPTQAPLSDDHTAEPDAESLVEDEADESAVPDDDESLVDVLESAVVEADVPAAEAVSAVPESATAVPLSPPVAARPTPASTAAPPTAAAPSRKALRFMRRGSSSRAPIACSRESEVAATASGDPARAAVLVPAGAAAGARRLRSRRACRALLRPDVSPRAILRVMCTSQRAWRTVCRATPAAMTTPLQSWTVAHSAELTPRIVAVPLATLVASGKSRTMPVTAHTSSASPVTTSTQ